jgi:NAD(P)-dependent dehydrogenase (short-subunit alcohol dehydrogenase family)
MRAVVVGASSGLGLDVSRLLLEEGCDVLGVARNAEKLRIAQGSESGKLFEVLELDMAAPESRSKLSEAIDRFEKIDILVVSAGSGSPLSGDLYETFIKSSEVNIAPALNAVDACHGKLGLSESPAVIFISSIAGNENTGAPAEYSAIKGALHVYTSHLSRKLAPIRFLTVAPGNFLSDNSVWKQKLESDKPSLDEYLRSNVSLNRLGQTQEIAKAVVFAASPAASFINGTVITVDGGQARGY